MPVSHDRKVKVEACKFGSQNNCKINGEEGRVAGGPQWQCAAVAGAAKLYKL